MTSSLFVAWRPPMPDRSGWRPVGCLQRKDELYRFFYTRGARRPPFRPFPGMSDLEQIYESVELFPLFANRLFSKSRPEYESFLKWGGLTVADALDPIVVLGVTEGLRATDAVEVFPCPQPDAGGCYTNKFFLHGIQWQSSETHRRISRLKSRERLDLVREPGNEYDPMAVAVTTTDRVPVRIGYVPRYLAYEIHRILDDCPLDFIHIDVEQVNPAAPMQNRVLCRMRACWPNGLRPCGNEDFQPIPEGVCTGREMLTEGYDG